MLSARFTLLATVILGFVGLIVAGAMTANRRVQTLGVAVVLPVAELAKGHELCETPIGLAGDLDAVTFNPAAPPGETPAITVSLRAVVGGRVLGRGVLPADFDPGLPQTVRLGRVHGDQLVTLCFRNRGPGPVSIFGDRFERLACTPSGRQANAPVICPPLGLRPTVAPATAVLDGTPVYGDVAATFLRADRRSVLGSVPAIAQRASLFRPAFVHPTLWWALLAGWVIVLPAGLVFALKAARPDAS